MDYLWLCLVFTVAAFLWETYLLWRQVSEESDSVDTVTHAHVNAHTCTYAAQSNSARGLSLQVNIVFILALLRFVALEIQELVEIALSVMIEHSYDYESIDDRSSRAYLSFNFLM